MLLHDDVVYQILQRLPVISILRFKVVCKTWRALIESNNFIKQHLHHHHHYDPDLKDKNHSLIRIVESKNTPFTFPLISIDSFEELNTCVQLDSSNLRECFPLDVRDTVSYNGIVCFSFHNFMRKPGICLWNPATRQSRVLPQSPAFALKKESSGFVNRFGFGFDVKNNDYKVVNICLDDKNERKVEVYSLDTDSWRSVTTLFPFGYFTGKPTIPFNNGTCFFLSMSNFGSKMILCFDFSSENFRSISFPNASDSGIYRYAIVVNDKIACVSNGIEGQTKIWVLNGYGSVNESWVELYTIDPLPTIGREMSMMLVFVNRNCLFFRALDWISGVSGAPVRTEIVCGYNVVSKELKNLSTVEIWKKNSVRSWHQYVLRVCYCSNECEYLVDFKESLLSVGKDQKKL